tara:strand:- start:5927 stop:6142 length:216 start_codon:yes stop_codon:yes gene_type:complete
MTTKTLKTEIIDYLKALDVKPDDKIGGNSCVGDLLISMPYMQNDDLSHVRDILAETYIKYHMTKYLLESYN